MYNVNTIFLSIFLLPWTNAKVPCEQVSVSFCHNKPDDPDVISTTHCSLEECKELCDNLPTCVFTEYLHKEEHCTLWAKQFSEYVQHCGALGAPKETPPECDINMDDDDDGCSVFRSEDCMVEEILETVTSLPGWSVCQAMCGINKDCHYWTWDRESKTCYLTSGVVSCYRTLAPGGVAMDQCQAS